MNRQVVRVVEEFSRIVVTAGGQGPAGPQGLSGGAAIFIQDITGINGIVAMKEWNPSVPAEVHLESATSDTATVRVHVGLGGGSDGYSPSVTVNSIPVTLSESSTKRWFTGFADVVVVEGENIIYAETSDGANDTAVLVLAGPGPDVLGVVFGAYPAGQTELKAGDTISFTVTTEPDATELTVLQIGASGSVVTLPVTAGTASGSLVISGLSGNQTIDVKAKNALGTFGNVFTSTPLALNQTYPTISTVTVDYPAGQGAFDTGQSGTMTTTISNFDTVAYSSTDVSIELPTSYTAIKNITALASGYIATGSNVTVVANRAANGATTVRTGLVKIASVAPTATISIAGSPARLVSSPAGINYEVRITPNQVLNEAPSLAASLGAWQGAWVLSGAYWKRNLRISDGTSRGAGVFSDLSMKGLSGITGTTIASGSSYSVGGMTSREITFPAFSRIAALGVSVGNESKTSAQVSGGNVLSRQASSAVVSNGYYIANSDGSYNPTGSYIGLSDTVFAGANTSGTLVILFEEVA